MGIDPGIGGGTALIDPQTKKLLGVEGWKTAADFVLLIRAWKCWSDNAPMRCYLESVHAMPKQGVVSVWTFAENFGFIKGTLESLGIPVTLVTPQKWQAALGTGRGDTKTAHKNNLKQFACRLYPEHKPTLKTADAMLIATYGMIYENAIPATKAIP